MSVINTNSLSLVAQGNLQKSQSSLGTAIERLSSGMRINSAKDDAAGQAIANRFTANIKGLTQATRNANDGISIAQTTEGSLNEINNNLQRIRELSVQSANGTNSSSDRASIQAEIRQRLDEIDRVSAQTQFNGVKVLAKDNTLEIQVGANDGETIKINLKEISSSTLGLSTFSVSGPKDGTTKAIAAADLEKIYGKDTKLNAGSLTVGNTTAVQTGIVTALGNGVVTADVTPATVVQDDTGSWFAKTTVTATAANLVGLNKAGFTNANGTDLTAGEKFDVYVAIDRDAGVLAGTNDGLAFTLQTSFTTQGLKDSIGTKDPLAALDKALTKVDDLRGELGAVQNRFQSTIANLSNTVTNLSASRSRIEDADYAVEVSNMTRAQILQQAGTSVLAQANQVPQTVLSLLR